MYGDDVEHSDILQMGFITDFLEHIDNLTEEANDPTNGIVCAAAFRERLAEYDPDRIAELRAMAACEDDSGFVSEKYWKEYQVQQADSLYGLEKSGASTWFDYDRYADDMLADYTAYQYDGVTYYASA